MKTVKIDLSLRIFLITIFSLILLVAGWELRRVLIGVIAMFFIAYILNSGLRPLVNKLEKVKIPRALAIFIIYLIVFVVIGGSIVLLASQLIAQVAHLLEALPGIYQRFVIFVQTSLPFLYRILPLELLGQQLGDLVNNLLANESVRGLISGQNILAVVSQGLGVLGGVAELLVGIVTVIMVSVYMLGRRQPVYEGMINLLPESQAKRIRRVLEKIEVSLGAWMVGQFIAMISIGLITYFIILIPGIFDAAYTLDDYALPLALMAGLLEALPNIGPLLTLIISVILALGTSGLGTVIYIIIAFTALQQVEGIFIIPLVMKRAIGIDPIASILGIIAGFQIAGIIGAILAIPLIGIVQLIIKEVAEEYKRAEKQRPKLIE